MMKDIECLQSMIQRRIDNLPSGYEGLYIEGSRDAYELVLQDIDQLDEPEVLSKKWIEEHTYYEDEYDFYYADPDELKNLLVPKHVNETITRAFDVERTSQTIEMLSGMTIEQVVEGFRDGKFDMKEELPMTKLETLTVPVDLGEWLQSRSIGDSGAYFSTIDSLFHYWDIESDTAVFNFISQNKKELIEVILGSRGYEVKKEPKYYALIKGHELVNDKGDWTFKYWKCDTSNGRVFPSHRLINHGYLLIEMSKEDWNDLGINDSNADFIRVEEMAE